MKRILYLSILTFCLSFTLYSQNYYWYKGKQIPLQQGELKYIVYEKNSKNANENPQLIESGEVDSYSQGLYSWGIAKNTAKLDTQNVVYQIPSFLCFNGTQNMFITHRFYVKLKNKDDFTLLQNLLKQYGAGLEATDKDLPLWNIIHCGLHSKYNALELANIFYETRLFDVAEPEIIHSVQMDCVNDTRFNYQWNLPLFFQSA